MHKLQSVQAVKDAPVNVISSPLTPWPTPPEEQPDGILFGDDDVSTTRILWGYWHTGEHTMPHICKLAVSSWRKKHPNNWTIRILSDDNYQNYVSVSDLPSTFQSLKVQHRSDLIRVAVLVRYGGAYLDVSTFMFKGLDGIWDTQQQKQQQQSNSNTLLLLTSTVQTTTGLNVANNALIFSPRRNNPVLKEHQQQLLKYLENPARNEEELRQNDAFAKIGPLLFNDPAMGILKEMVVYGSNVWLLNEVLLRQLDNNKNSSDGRNDVYFLPTRRWTFDFLSLPALNSNTDNDDPSKDPTVTSWSMFRFLWWMICRCRDQFGDSPERAKRLAQQLNVMKVSTDDINFGDTDDEDPCHTQRTTTISRLYCYAISDEEPIVQATLDGAIAASPKRNDRQESEVRGGGFGKSIT